MVECFWSGANKGVLYMKIQSWPRLAKRDVRLLRERKLVMEETTGLWERFALLPLLILSIICSILSLFYGQSGTLILIVWVNMIAFSIYGFTRFPGRIIALFFKRLDLKKHQLFRHAKWHIRRGFRNFLKRYFKYRRFKDVPDAQGNYRNEIIIT